MLTWCEGLQGPFSLNDADVTYRLIIADRAHADSVPDVVVTSCAAGSELLLQTVNTQSTHANHLSRVLVELA